MQFLDARVVEQSGPPTRKSPSKRQKKVVLHKSAIKASKQKPRITRTFAKTPVKKKTKKKSIVNQIFSTFGAQKHAESLSPETSQKQAECDLLSIIEKKRPKKLNSTPIKQPRRFTKRRPVQRPRACVKPRVPSRSSAMPMEGSSHESGLNSQSDSTLKSMKSILTDNNEKTPKNKRKRSVSRHAPDDRSDPHHYKPRQISKKKGKSKKPTKASTKHKLYNGKRQTKSKTDSRRARVDWAEQEKSNSETDNSAELSPEQLSHRAKSSVLSLEIVQTGRANQTKTGAIRRSRTKSKKPKNPKKYKKRHAGQSNARRDYIQIDSDDSETGRSQVKTKHEKRDALHPPTEVLVEDDSPHRRLSPGPSSVLRGAGDLGNVFRVADFVLKHSQLQKVFDFRFGCFEQFNDHVGSLAYDAETGAVKELFCLESSLATATRVFIVNFGRKRWKKMVERDVLSEPRPEWRSRACFYCFSFGFFFKSVRNVARVARHLKVLGRVIEGESTAQAGPEPGVLLFVAVGAGRLRGQAAADELFVDAEVLFRGVHPEKLGLRPERVLGPETVL